LKQHQVDFKNDKQCLKELIVNGAIHFGISPLNQNLFSLEQLSNKRYSHVWYRDVYCKRFMGTKLSVLI